MRSHEIYRYRGFRRNKCKREKGIWSAKWYYSEHGSQKSKRSKRKKT